MLCFSQLYFYNLLNLPLIIFCVIKCATFPGNRGVISQVMIGKIFFKTMTLFGVNEGLIFWFLNVTNILYTFYGVFQQYWLHSTHYMGFVWEVCWGFIPGLTKSETFWIWKNTRKCGLLSFLKILQYANLGQYRIFPSRYIVPPVVEMERKLYGPRKTQNCP